MMNTIMRCSAACVIFVLASAVAEDAQQRSVVIHALADKNLPAMALDKGVANVVNEGPSGAQATRFDSDFAGRFDLKPLAVDPLKFDLIKVQVKADRGAFLRFSLENFPQPGQLSHWYVLDTARGAFDWRTIWIDLNKPEEIKAAGTYKGMGDADPAARGLRFDGMVKDLKRAAQGQGRSIWIGNIDICKKAIDIDWDQSKFSYIWETGKDLVYTFPLTVSNKTDKPITAALRLLPFRAADAKPGVAVATLSVEKIPLAAGETKTIDARISLPSEFAAGAPPLYAEAFEVRAKAGEIPNSEVTILRSSDPIHLTVVVPVAEEKLTFPLLPHKSVSAVRFNEATARAAADAANPDDLNTSLGGPFGSAEAHDGLFGNTKKNAEWALAGQRFTSGLTACAFLYDQTGDKKCLEKGTAMLLRAAQLFRPRQDEWRKTPHSMISSGIFAASALPLGWVTGGMRPAYSYDRHGIFNDFDLLAPGMDAATREKIIRDFIVPAAIQLRNHYIGLTNQQDVINYPIMYAGLVGRNWPLSAFAYNSEHGVLGQLQWGFSDDGLAGEVNYHGPALDGISWTAELLNRIGIDIFTPRLYECFHSTAAAALGKPYRDPIVGFFEQNRFKPEHRVATVPTDGTHLKSGMTLLKWKDKEVCMNWGEQLNRSACDRCALRITTGKGESATTVGGGNYTHSSLGQSIIIVDENLQDPVPATVTGVNVTGPVQFIQATSDKHYPGVAITRTFALIDKHVLVVDRVISNDGQPHSVDWCLRFRGGTQKYEDVAKGISLPLKTTPGSFTNKPSDNAKGASFGATLRFPEYLLADDTVKPWRQSQGNMLMAGETGTRVMAFAVHASFSAWRKEVETGVPVMMVRRSAIKETDFISVFSPDVKSVEKVPVKTTEGKPANAIGVKVLLNDGQLFSAIVNYEPPGVGVVLDELKTQERFATTYH